MYRNSAGKYKAKKITVDGIVFDSQKEASRYRELRLLEQAGAIEDLQMQVAFELIPKQTEKGKCVERSCKYIADFVYREKGQMIVEDVKGFKTPEYTIKRKLMRFIHGIGIREV